jgi:uncharacterized protein (UPF0371 family)
MKSTGFDNEKYIRVQSERILERINSSGGRLYLEFGGKLFDDFHASRVLPGFRPDSKVHMLLKMRDEVEVVVVISVWDIEQSKRRSDSGITYDQEVLRLIDACRSAGLCANSVVVTHYGGQPAAKQFIKRLAKQGINTYRHHNIEDYPHNLSLILSEGGFGRNEAIEPTRRIVVITAPGGGSGKMAVCLSQLYHEHNCGRKASYAKYETFPVWNLPPDHPINVAYEAATADLGDVVMPDTFHQVAYEEPAVSYNRDMENFPVLLNMLGHITGSPPYKSPTDMGVNTIKSCITDDGEVSGAAQQEIIRRYYDALCAQRRGFGEAKTAERLEALMAKAGVSPAGRPVVAAALGRSTQTDEQPAVAIELPDGQVVTGKTTGLLGAASAALLNALKKLGGTPKDVLLISPDIIGPVSDLKINHMGNTNPRLHTDEVLIALAISASAGGDTPAAAAMKQLGKLAGCEAHSTVILAPVDCHTFQRLGINLTCEPKSQTMKLFYG